MCQIWFTEKVQSSSEEDLQKDLEGYELKRRYLKGIQSSSSFGGGAG